MTEFMRSSSLGNVSSGHLSSDHKSPNHISSDHKSSDCILKDSDAGLGHQNSIPLAEHDHQVTQFLAQYERFGIDLGLDRILRLLQALDNPQNQVPIIHVAGSNGKGSVCAYLASMLAAAGYRVGRYISPHLVSWCERISINDQPIAADQLSAVLAQVAVRIDPQQPSPTQFEVITAAAWCYFAAQKVDIAVIEVGLGGRLDATNVCDQPLVTVITSLSMEHWQRLGPTLADIAREKAGILKPGCPAVIGPLPPEAKAVVEQQLLLQNCPAIWPEAAQPIVTNTRETRWGQTTSQTTYQTTDWAVAEGIQFPLPLPGQFQLSNAALAIASIQQLRRQGWVISDEAIVLGMAQTRWPGRMQWFTWQGRAILIDGAHNPAAAIVLRQYVDSLTPLGQPLRPIAWVMGMLTTKDHADVFRALLKPGDRLHLVPVPGHSGADPAELAELAQQICPSLHHCQTHRTLLAGLELASEEQATLQAAVNRPEATSSLKAYPEQLSSDPLVVLCGSLYLIGDFFAHLQRD
jgi:dihydrofolate synthase / folylpolyglutamate synthase